jgi:hypothetical protein
MLNNLQLVQKVLNYIDINEVVTLDNVIMKSIGGFKQLAEVGYIEINEIDNEYFATLTNKGLAILKG